MIYLVYFKKIAVVVVAKVKEVVETQTVNI